MSRDMLYVEYPLAKSLQEAIDCLKNGGQVWQEDSNDFPACGGFEDVDCLLENFPEEEYKNDLNFEQELLHLVPKDMEEIEAKPFEIGETVWARETYFPDKDSQKFYVHAGDANKIININSDGNIQFVGNDKDVWWDADKFCRCILPVDREKVYIIANLLSGYSGGYDFDGVYKELEFLKEECEGNIIWSDEYENFVKYMESLSHDVSGSNWDISGHNRETGELVYGVQQCFLKTK